MLLPLSSLRLTQAPEALACSFPKSTQWTAAFSELNWQKTSHLRALWSSPQLSSSPETTCTGIRATPVLSGLAATVATGQAWTRWAERHSHTEERTETSSRQFCSPETRYPATKMSQILAFLSPPRLILQYKSDRFYRCFDFSAFFFFFF